jgi:spore coat polysaccharide biosynthesis protein SpsF
MLAVVSQARMTSVRLPGKSLRALDGERTTLQLHVERLMRCERPDLVVVTTSIDPSDDPVTELCERLGVEVHRGPLEDVAKRFYDVIDRFGLDAFVRVTGDSPLLDQRLVDAGIDTFREGGHEIVSNIRPSTYASGHSWEAVDAAAFREAYPDMSEPVHFEHVTNFLYHHPERFRFRNVRQERDDGAINLSVDTEDDARLVGAILARMDRPHWDYGYEEVMNLYREAVGGGPA